MTKTAAKKTDDAKRTRGEKKTWEYRLERVMSRETGQSAVGGTLVWDVVTSKTRLERKT